MLQREISRFGAICSTNQGKRYIERRIASISFRKCKLCPNVVYYFCEYKKAMLCYAMLCCAMLCCMLFCALLCFAMLCCSQRPECTIICCSGCSPTLKYNIICCARCSPRLAYNIICCVMWR